MGKRRGPSSRPSPSSRTTINHPHEPTTGRASHIKLPPKLPVDAATDHRSAYTQLAIDDNVPEPSFSRHDAEDDEIDELASTSLVNVPIQPFTQPSTMRDTLRPTHMPAEAAGNSYLTRAKPLPSLPSEPPPKRTEASKTNTKVLGPKSTNQKVVHNMAKVPPRPSIPPPTLMSSSIGPFLGTVAAGGLARRSTDDLDSRVSSLTRQADSHQAETKAREKLLAVAEASFRPSPLQRGRSVLMTAKHAIATRLGSPKIRLGRFKTPLSRKSSAPTGTPVNQTPEPVSVVPRPLPVYESMRSRRETPEPQDNDPFSDEMEMDEAWSDIDFNFGRYKDQGVGAQVPSSSRTSSVNRLDEPASEALLIPCQTTLSFSNKVSGLKQHPDPEFFSSSPVGFSTPRVQLEPTADADGKKRLSTVLVRDPVVYDINVGRDSTDSDDDDNPAVHNDLNAARGLNMKRKSATEDLHAQMAKRAKTDSGASGGTARLAQGFGNMGTNNRHSMQDVEGIAGGMTLMENLPQGQGFGIFDTNKGKEIELRVRDSVEISDLRRHSRRYSSSSSRPTSVLFSRETRAKVPLLDSYKEDEMDIDELHMDDPHGRS